MYAIPLIAKSAMNGAQLHAQRVGDTGGGLVRNKSAGSTKRDVDPEFYGVPPVGQRRPMDGAPGFSTSPVPKSEGPGAPSSGQNPSKSVPPAATYLRINYYF
jgi:hypothetical protein